MIEQPPKTASLAIPIIGHGYKELQNGNGHTSGVHSHIFRRGKSSDGFSDDLTGPLTRSCSNGAGGIEPRDDDVLSPLPGEEGGSACSSPGPVSYLSRSPVGALRLGACISPLSMRRRAQTLDNDSEYARKQTSSPGTLGYAKDPIQPKQGSIQDIHKLEEGGEEEDDVFSELCALRPRANTCPASTQLRNAQRRAKLRTMHRPGTPPPSDLECTPRSSPQLSPEQPHPLDSTRNGTGHLPLRKSQSNPFKISRGLDNSNSDPIGSCEQRMAGVKLGVKVNRKKGLSRKDSCESTGSLSSEGTNGVYTIEEDSHANELET